MKIHLTLIITASIVVMLILCFWISFWPVAAVMLGFVALLSLSIIYNYFLKGKPSMEIPGELVNYEPNQWNLNKFSTLKNLTIDPLVSCGSLLWRKGHEWGKSINTILTPATPLSAISPPVLSEYDRMSEAVAYWDDYGVLGLKYGEKDKAGEARKVLLLTLHPDKRPKMSPTEERKALNQCLWVLEAYKNILTLSREAMLQRFHQGKVIGIKNQIDFLKKESSALKEEFSLIRQHNEMLVKKIQETEKLIEKERREKIQIERKAKKYKELLRENGIFASDSSSDEEDQNQSSSNRVQKSNS